MNLIERATQLTTGSIARLRLLVRAFGYFRPDGGRMSLSLGLLLAGIGVNLLKPWPLAILVDSVLGNRPYPIWLPSDVQAWTQPTQITAIIAASLVIYMAHSAICAGHVYLTIGIGLRGLRRVRDAVFSRIQRLSLRYHHCATVGDTIFRAGTDTGAFQILFQEGLLIVISAMGTLLFMTIMMVRLNLYLTAIALV